MEEAGVSNKAPASTKSAAFAAAAAASDGVMQEDEEDEDADGTGEDLTEGSEVMVKVKVGVHEGFDVG